MASAVPSGAATSVYQPPAQVEWQWEIGHALNTSSASDMGTGAIAYNGDTAPGTNPTLYDIDGIDNSASTVSTLHNMGDHAICYIEVGTAGNYYSAADEGIPTTYYQQLSNAGDLGKKLGGYPEKFININAPSAVTIIEAMIDQQCANKGFDSVETDLDETFNNNEGHTGFTITQADEQSYLTTLANYMHGLGLGWTAKNPDDTGVQSFVTFTASLAQDVITEECNKYGTCNLLAPYSADGKAILNAEYTQDRETTAKFCPSDNASGFNGVLWNEDLDGGRQPCR